MRAILPIMALALGAVALGADARPGAGGDRPGAGKPGFGSHGHRDHGHRHHRHHHHGHWHHGFHRPWAWGVGVGLAWPAWGYYNAYPAYPYYRYAPYPYPSGVVIERHGAPPPEAAPAEPGSWRWYCPASGGYHPEVQECTEAWLRVLPPAQRP